MFNYRQSNVIEKNTFSDEFQVQEQVETKREVSSEEKAFNSKIADNFDRIIHYDSYNRAGAVTEQRQAMQNFVSGNQYDVNPSSTTMQFKDMPRAEIYQDYRVQNDYKTETRVRPRAKLAVFALSLVVIILSILVVFNTALLNSMNDLIAGRQAELSDLQTQSQVLTDELNDVSSDQSIIDAALEIGMKR